jgi:hypothetical protein
MPKNLTIGNEVFEFPIDGENSGWGSEVTDWAEAVTDALSVVQKPNDILLTTATIANNISSPTNIPGFSFSTAEVVAIECRYLINRTTTVPNAVYSEVGYIEGYFDGSDWGYSIRTTGESEVLLSITPAGQIQYTSSNLSGATHVATITFEARVIND